MIKSHFTLEKLYIINHEKKNAKSFTILGLVVTSKHHK